MVFHANSPGDLGQFTVLGLATLRVLSSTSGPVYPQVSHLFQWISPLLRYPSCSQAQGSYMVVAGLNGCDFISSFTSRFACVFSSTLPRSAFFSGGWAGGATQPPGVYFFWKSLGVLKKAEESKPEMSNNLQLECSESIHIQVSATFLFFGFCFCTNEMLSICISAVAGSPPMIIIFIGLIPSVSDSPTIQFFFGHFHPS